MLFRSTTQGVYDPWVKSSLAELAKLKPVRYAKTERGDVALGQEVPALQTALLKAPDSVPLLNQLGITQRQLGQFEQARLAYEAAIAANASAPLPHLNLAILYDLYLGDVAKAQVLYQRFVELSPADATQLNRWLAELMGRKAAPGTPPSTSPSTAQAPAAAAAAGTAPGGAAQNSAAQANASATRKDKP